MISEANLYKNDIEKSVLSSLMFDNDSFFTIEILSDYFTGNRGLIFEAIRKIISNNGDANLVSVSTSLRGVVDASLLSSIAEFPVSTNLEFSVAELAESSRLRNLYRSLNTGINMCLNGQASSEIISSVNKIFVATEKSGAVKIENVLPDIMREIDEISAGNRSPGILTGISGVDRSTGGFGAEFAIIAGRPGSGKTSLAMNFARNFAWNGMSGIIFSLEMPKNQLVKRLLCDVGDIDSDLIFKGGVSKLFGRDKDSFFENINAASTAIARMPIEIDDTASLTIDQIYVRAKKAKKLNDIKWIVIDYIGLIKGWNERGQGPKAEITRQMKVMSKDLDLPVFALSQMNRAIEGRAERTPKMSDLRDAGSIEQDADIVIFPDAIKQEYEQNVKQKDYVDVDIYIAKNRRGSTGVVRDVKWQGEYFRFSNNVARL